eukprot:s1168_g7.t1
MWASSNLFQRKADLQQRQQSFLQEREMLQQQVQEAYSQQDFGNVKLNILILDRIFLSSCRALWGVAKRMEPKKGQLVSKHGAKSIVPLAAVSTTVSV